MARASARCHKLQLVIRMGVHLQNLLINYLFCIILRQFGAEGEIYMLSMHILLRPLIYQGGGMSTTPRHKSRDKPPISFCPKIWRVNNRFNIEGLITEGMTLLQNLLTYVCQYSNPSGQRSLCVG